MEDPSRAIDELLVPGMTELNVSEGLDRAANLVGEMRESEQLCKRALERLQFLRHELKMQISQADVEKHSRISAQLAKMVGLCIHLLKKHSQKKLLQRLASSRLLHEQVHELQAKINDVFILAGLSSTREMVIWRQHEAEDIAAQREHFNELVQNLTTLTSDLSNASLEEALTELKVEIDSRQNSKDFVILLERALQAASGGKPITAPPSWYIRRDDVVINEEIDVGTFGTVHKGKWGAAGTIVAVKRLFMDSLDAQKSFLREADIWHRLSHSHIIKMYGGCHVGKPLFFVSEFTKNGNFVDYFDKPENKSNLWRLFHQAAQGLYHLHSLSIIHSDIKCSNILVGNDGTAKLCDFGFSYIRTLSFHKSVKETPSTARWKAPECLLNQGVDANPIFKSDVYSLGMSIIEAKIGGVPWGMVDDDTIIENMVDEIVYPRPEGVFTDNEWALVRAMTDYDVEKRITLVQAFEHLQELSEAELGRGVVAIVCGNCYGNNECSKRFCGDCGAALAKP